MLNQYLSKFRRKNKCESVVYVCCVIDDKKEERWWCLRSFSKVKLVTQPPDQRESNDLREVLIESKDNQIMYQLSHK